MLRLFEDCLHSSISEDEGWCLLQTVVLTGNLTAHGEWYTSWLLRRLRNEMMDTINERAFDLATRRTVQHADQTSSRMLLDVHKNAAHPIDRGRLLWILIFSIRKDHTENFRYLVERGANIHWIHDGETPTSLAIRSSFAFLRWLALLQSVDQGYEHFIKRELAWKGSPLYKRGWRRDTLRELFLLCTQQSIYPAGSPTGLTHDLL